MHRLLAYEAARGHREIPEDSKAFKWLESGQGDYPDWNRIAQALADTEAEALAEREHMMEAVRLLSAVSRTASFLRVITASCTDLLCEDLTRWLEAERARKASER